MANLTDPLAAHVHGTDPQNLLEYIVRQKIYDTRYWKEECFGLTAADVLEKSSSLVCVGGAFGGNQQPTKFLCLCLKLLQIQPPIDLIEDVFIGQEEFKYARCLGALHLRLCGRPAEIYQHLEPLLRDYRKLKYRNTTEWSLLHVDEFVHQLLTSERVCGIALPRLAQRQTLFDEGYLDDEKYNSPLYAVVSINNNDDDVSATPQARIQALEDYLYQKVLQDSPAAKALWAERQALKKQGTLPTTRPPKPERGPIKEAQREQNPVEEEMNAPEVTMHRAESSPKDDAKEKSSKKKKKKKHKDYGSLFKKKTSTQSAEESSSPAKNDAPVDENSTEYWNEQRAKLGLKPLKEG